jgi:hypothetical protein
MKTKIYYTGLIAALLVFLGVLFKIQHWPGAFFALAGGIFILLFVFLPFALRSNYKAEGTRGSAILYIVIWITCLVVLMSMLFKIQHWPGAGYLLIAAIPFPYVVFLPVYLIVTGKNQNHNIYNTVAILFLLTIVSALSALLSLGVTREKLTDSLLISGNYSRTETALESVVADNESSALTLKVDEALDLLNKYEDLRFLGEGITQQQWIENPYAIFQSSLKPIGSAGTRESVNRLYGELQSALSDIIGIVKSSSADKPLSDNIGNMLGMKKSSGEGYYFADPLFTSNLQPWEFVYLDGLRVNLMMIKVTAE